MAIPWKGKPKYGKFGLTLNFNLKEGQVKEFEGSRIGGASNTFVFANELFKGDFVKLAGDMLVEKATNDSDVIIGQMVSVADYPRVEPDRGDKELGELFDFVVDGEQKYRTASIEIFGEAIRTVKVNNAVAAGDYIKYAGSNVFTKAANGKKTNAIALKSVTSAGEVPVLFNYKPLVEE